MEATQCSGSSSPPKKNIITLDLDNISENDILPLITRLLEQQAKSVRNTDDDIETQAQPISEEVVETVTKLLDRTLTRRHSTRRQKSLERQSSVEDDDGGVPQDVGQQAPENSLIENMLQTEDLINQVASLTLERTAADEPTDEISPLQDSPTTMSALLTIENSSSLDAELDQLTFSAENSQLETQSNPMLNESQMQPAIPSEAPAGAFINTAYSNVFNQERVTEEMRSELFSKVSMMMHQESLQNGYITGECQIEQLPTTENSNVTDVTMNAETTSSPVILPPPLPPKDEEKPRPFTRRLTLTSSSDRPLPPKPEEFGYQSVQNQHPPPSILSSISVSLPNMNSISLPDSRPASVASSSSLSTPALSVQNELLPPPHRPRPTSDPIGPAVHLSNLESFDSNRNRSRASSVPASANQNQLDQQHNPQNTDSQPPRSKSPHPPRGVSKSRSPVHVPQQAPPDVPPLPTTVIVPTSSVAESPQTPHNVLPNNNYLPRTIAHVPSSQATPPQFFRPFLQGGLQQQPVPQQHYVNSNNVPASNIPPRQASFYSNQASRPRPGPLPVPNASPNHDAPYNPGQSPPIFQNLAPPRPPPHFVLHNSMPQNRPSVQYIPLPVSQSSPHIPASLSSNRPPQISPQMPLSSPFQHNPSYRPQFVPQNSPSPNRPPTNIASFAGASYNELVVASPVTFKF
ncbi:hypothetical protein BKA69DRAFT_21161 [Paraphysoderma sedebokerense]|nr:hypothetical protein BKA69DRAFT_21161 [Paraphysoderma sedebokerense]